LGKGRVGWWDVGQGGGVLDPLDPYGQVREEGGMPGAMGCHSPC